MDEPGTRSWRIDPGRECRSSIRSKSNCLKREFIFHSLSHTHTLFLSRILSPPLYLFTRLPVYLAIYLSASISRSFDEILFDENKISGSDSSLAESKTSPTEFPTRQFLFTRAGFPRGNARVGLCVLTSGDVSNIRGRVRSVSGPLGGQVGVEREQKCRDEIRRRVLATTTTHPLEY